MSLLSDLSPRDLSRCLAQGELRLRTGPFVYRIGSPFAEVCDGLRVLYADASLAETGREFVDFHIDIARGAGVRRWLAPQSRFLFDGRSIFEPMPASHAYPLLEWAMNWCVSSQAHQYLILHAAVLAHNGLAVVMPAPPGSGKSTLCAGLALAGWQLLSDELALLSREGPHSLTALGRPVSLKNASIDVIRSRAPQAVMNQPVRETHKGTVAHLKAGSAVADLGSGPVRPRWIIFPRWQAGAPATLAARSRAESMLELGRNGFNYLLQGASGFNRLADTVAGCDCYDFRYGDLDEAIAVFDELAARG